MYILQIDESIFGKILITFIDTNLKTAKHISIPLEKFKNYILFFSQMIHNKIDIVLLDLQGHGLYIKDLLANNLISKEDYNKIIDYKNTFWRIDKDEV